MKTKDLKQLTRRTFLKHSALALGATAVGAGIQSPLVSRAQDRQKTPAAIIGHTGQGDYGHGLDQIFNNRDNI